MKIIRSADLDRKLPWKLRYEWFHKGNYARKILVFAIPLTEIDENPEIAKDMVNRFKQRMYRLRYSRRRHSIYCGELNPRYPYSRGYFKMNERYHTIKHCNGFWNLLNVAIINSEVWFRVMLNISDQIANSLGGNILDHDIYADMLDHPDCYTVHPRLASLKGTNATISEIIALDLYLNNNPRSALTNKIRIKRKISDGDGSLKHY